MKKYLLSALALPLLFACSSEDYLDQKATDNDQFAGIEKVDATFSMAESPKMRMDNGSWLPQEKDMWGFAWMGDGTVIANNPANGKAYQNHNLIQTDGIFKPQTSIYVGKYYLYRPYDKTTVNIGNINFKSLENQALAEGYASTTQAWKDLAKTAINIGDKWTDVVSGGRTYGGTEKYDEPGITKKYKIFAAMFSNQTGLDLKYEKNNPTFAADQAISGATDINHTFAAGTAVGAADIYSGTVDLQSGGASVAANSFTYAPTVEPNDGVYPQTVGGKTVYHNGDFWADKKNLAAVLANNPGDGFTFTDGAITLNSPDADEDGVLDGISTGDNGSTAWFWFNSLPVTAGTGDEGTQVIPVFETSYGTVTVNKSYSPDVAYTVGDCAFAGNVESGTMVWHPLSDAGDATKTPAVWALTGAGAPNTFINQYGNHKGKFKLTVDFSKGVMNNMHIKNDAHLQKLLKYYLASGKTETGVVLNLDGDANKEFKISKISIALLQTIGGKVKVQACTDAAHNTPVKIIVTQDGQAELGLADKKEVPALNNVFAVATDVYLSKDCQWTWKGGTDGKTALPVDANVTSITNEGTLTVNATNIAMVNGTTLQGNLANAAGATMNITQVTTVKNALTNLGTINVGSESNTSAELRAYDVVITNDANKLLTPDEIIKGEITGNKEIGRINNYGVVGVSDIGASGKFNNYGLIDVKNAGAITLLSTNQKVSDFDDHFNAASNKMGTVKLPSPTALVSVANKDANGFIAYNWTGTRYATPEGNVKFNTIVVSGDIEFTETENEIQYVVFDGTRTQVVNTGGYLKKLKGVIVNAGKSIIIEKDNQLKPSDGTFLGKGATVYNGGAFTHNASLSGTTASNYFGDWETTQIVKY